MNDPERSCFSLLDVLVLLVIFQFILSCAPEVVSWFR